MKKSVFSLSLTALLAACSSTKVHLFTQGIEDKELSRVSESLIGQGFKVYLNGLTPPDFVGPVMIYSPAHPHFSDIDKLRKLLTEMGYPEIDPVAMIKDNHSYTGKNVGVYLGHPELNSKQLTNHDQIPFDFAGRCHVDDAYLTLNPDGTFSIEIIQWVETEEVIKVTGQWETFEDTLLLSSGSSTVNFHIEYLKYADNNGLHQDAHLTSLSADGVLSSCKFTHSILRDL